MNSGEPSRPAEFNRPGVSDAFLADAGCAHIGGNECVRLYGFKAEGIAIPFRDLSGSPVMDGDRPFVRVRLYDATDDQKYHQRSESGVHIYIPPGFADAPKHSTLVLVEGEFKATSLTEAGYAALGLCGLNGACRTVDDGEGRTLALSDELAALLEYHRPARVVFLGDADVSLNAQFSVEAAKLRKLIRGTKRFQFVEHVLAAKPPVDGAKGIDDCRAQHGDSFNAWFESLLANAFDIPAKATAAEVFTEFLRREAELITKWIAADSREARRARVRLLQSAAQLWNEPGAKLDLSPLLCRVLGVVKKELPSLIRDATNSRKQERGCVLKQNHPIPRAILIEPWTTPVNGAELLDALAAEFRKFLVLPPHADTVLALWTLHTYSWQQCEYSPIIAITSPVRSCGKSRVLDVLEKLVSNPFRTGNMSEPVLFRVLDSRKPSVLIDEFDTIPEERRDALANILKHGFHSAGRVHRVEGDSEKKIVEFVVFGPKALACIKLSTLDAPTVSRCINIRMQRKKTAQKVERLRRYSGAEWQRKSLRWTNDHRERIESAIAEMPEVLGDREQDIYEPLFVLASMAGGDWPDKIARAALALCGESSDAATDSSVLLLGWIQTHFTESGTDKVSSAALVQWLNGREDAPFSLWSNGKGIGQNEVRRLLAGFEIQPNTVRLGDRTAKGYARVWFQGAFDSYLPKFSAANSNAVTTPATIGDSSVLPSVTAGECYQLQTRGEANKDGHCYPVTAANTETATAKKELMEEMV
jgi:hypothetical protein